MQIIPWFRKNKTTLLIAATIILAAILHFRNLSGALYLDDDEARAFALLSSGQMLYLMCRPFFLISLSQSSAFYVTAFLGVANIALFYLLLRMYFDKKVSFLAVVFYAFFPLRIDYARTLYPAVFVEFYFFIALIFLALSTLKNNPRYSFFSGLAVAGMFFSHYSSYGLIIGLVIFVIISSILRKEDAVKISLAEMFLYSVFGVMVAYSLISQLLSFIGNNYDLTKNIFSFHEEDLTAVVSLYRGGHEWIFKRILSKLSEFKTIGLLTLFLFLFFGLLRKNKNLILLGSAYISAFSILLVMALLGYHTFKVKHCVWLISLICLCFSWVLVYLYSRDLKLVKVVVCLVAGFSLFWMFYLSYQITNETYTNYEINSWLTEHNISKRYVISCWDLYRKGEEENSSKIPLTFVNPKVKYAVPWYINASPQIYWPLVFLAYEKGKCKYIITSGTSTNIEVGGNDPLLRVGKSLAVWLHPVCRFKHRFFYAPEPKRYIKIYDLEEVLLKASSAKVDKK